jgi:POT family proton-dependent oligopeptide transporter
VASVMMGVNFLSNFAGNYMAGYLGSFWSGMPKTHFFAMIAGISAATSLAIFALSRVLNPILAEDKGGLDAQAALQTESAGPPLA